MLRTLLLIALFSYAAAEEWNCVDTTGTFDLSDDCALDGEIVLSGDLEITGILKADGSYPVITAAADSRHFYSKDTSSTKRTLTLKNLKMTGGRPTSTTTGSGYGGSIYFYHKNSHMDISHCIFSDNQTPVSKYGGAVYYYYSYGGARTAAFSHVTMDSNSASNGGAMYLYRVDATFSHVTMDSNSANYGGALYLEYGSLTEESSTYTNNIGSWGGAVMGYYPTISSTDSLFRNNTAGSAGGAMYLYGSSSKPVQLNLTRAALEENKQTDGGDYGGGGLYLSTEVTATISECTFTRNEATAETNGEFHGHQIMTSGSPSIAFDNTQFTNVAGDHDFYDSTTGAGFTPSDIYCSSDTVCATPTTCTHDQYEATPATETTDRVCSLPTTCVAGTYISTAHTATTDRSCSPCADGTFTAVENSATCQVHPCSGGVLNGSDPHFPLPDANGHANIHGTVVPANAYKDCSMLTSITISPATTTISEGAFLNTGLVSVDVPDTVTAIGNTAFGSTTEISAPCCASLTTGDDATILNSEQFLTTYDLDTISHVTRCGYCVGDGRAESGSHYGDFTCDGDGNLVNEGGPSSNFVCVDKTGAPESEWVETFGKCLMRCVPKTHALGFQSAAKVLTLPTYDPNSPHYTDLNDFKSKVDASLSATINHPSSTFVVKNCGANFNYDRCVGVGNVGCTDAGFLEYSSTATSDDGSCATPKIEGCTYDAFDNHIANANYDDGTCATLSVLSDCSALKTAAEGVCTKGCMYDSFDNHNPASTYDDGTCETLSVLSDCNALTTAASSACDATNNRVCVERVVYN